MSIFQIHHQFKDRTQIIAQCDDSGKTNSEIREFISNSQKLEPLPKGAEWLICFEKSKYFIKGVRKP